MKRITLIITLTIIIYQLSVFPLFAQSSLGLSAIPPRLEILANPGETVTKEVKIRNISSSDKLINTSSKNFVVLDDIGTPTQFDNTNEGTNRWASSSWVHISNTTFTLKPGEIRSLNITINVPKTAIPGGYYNMILHNTKNEAYLNSSGSLVETNVGTLLYITVPGNIQESAQITNFFAPKFSEYGPINLNVTIRNTSDIHISPVGTITISNWLGGQTAKLDLNPTNIFPYTSRNLTNTLSNKWLFGRYTASLKANFGFSNQSLNSTIYFWVFPWRFVTLIIIALILITVITILIKKKQPKLTSNESQILELSKELDSLKKTYTDRR